MEIIQYKGLDELDEAEKEVVKEISAENHPKIRRELHNDTSLEVHIKVHTKQGSKKKYTVHIRANAPTRKFEAEHHDWDLPRALRRAYDSMIVEVSKAFKKDAGYNKTRR